jgi:peroxiredoxin
MQRRQHQPGPAEGAAQLTAQPSEFLSYPAPQDDGAARGLEGRSLPDLELMSTDGASVNLARAALRLVLYVYPSATGTPDLPAPNWKDIPGAFGCTAESCAFRDRMASFEALRVTVMGLSAQTTEAQRAFAQRKEINFPLLSDAELRLSKELRLPTFAAGSLQLYKRLTIVAESGVIVKVFYPVYPPDTHPAEVLAWAVNHFKP